MAVNERAVAAVLARAFQSLQFRKGFRLQTSSAMT
jgi:hypothetical protein